MAVAKRNKGKEVNVKVTIKYKVMVSNQNSANATAAGRVSKNNINKTLLALTIGMAVYILCSETGIVASIAKNWDHLEPKTSLISWIASITSSFIVFFSRKG